MSSRRWADDITLVDTVTVDLGGRVNGKAMRIWILLGGLSKIKRPYVSAVFALDRRVS